MSKYKTNNHSKYLITYHIIFVIKYRKRLLEMYGEITKKLMIDIAEQSNFEISEMEVDNDHIHLMIESEPKLSALQIVRRLKQETTVGIWRLPPP